ncbi:fungal-specific transcription factor domain-containing protein [Durotheca rogersii]|uniref:fungal-specific transcription factor domain-containing protein n=1 Tax=Durotheca rogersii TaxID=419775 RepID=UPI00221EF060|nr:fungal-specific transcription factor domain-containing protein [Durotheca rogersii]KAI5861557.1 fungal-specific transcription factor domain-containing protein [Durotheca rogersii]
MQRSKRRSSSNGGQRSFACAHEGCGKSFTRSEHLHRHRKNHTDGDWTCQRCRAHFKRPDLLERHMSRHRKRDIEAGGEGIGVLNTRKRMWKDHNGRIVQKRPAETPAPDGPHLAAAYLPQAKEPISPPDSLHTPVHGDRAPAPQPAFTTDDPHGVIADYALSTGQFDAQGAGPYWSLPETSQAGGAGMMSSNLDLNYDEVFQPDTSSSFNMPYTTQVNYDWLFNLDYGTAAASDMPQAAPYLAAAPPLPRYPCGDLPPPLPAPPLPHDPGQGDSSMADCPMTPMGSPLDYARSLTSPHHAAASPSASVSSFGQPQASAAGAVAEEAVEMEFERPLTTLRPPQRLPALDSFAYAQLLETVQAARPLAPDGGFVDVAHHPLLARAALQIYCDLFFTRFNTAYPLIHLPTFDPARKEPLLLISIILLGASYADKDAHQLAVCIHDVIRPAIFSHASFNPKPDLWMLQTILLVECFGKSRAGQKQHDMSHLFHGMLINLIRRSDCQSVRPVRPGGSSADIAADATAATDEHAWRRWVEAEEKKRLALLSFMWDTQHAVLFCQSLCMSAFELRLPLPCNQALWEAPGPAEWARLSLLMLPEPLYLSALKSYITADARAPSHHHHHHHHHLRHPFPHLNGLSRILLFHGLMSIFWDMQRRDQTSLGNAAGGRWQARLEAAYRAWRADFDGFCARQAALATTFAGVSDHPVARRRDSSSNTTHSASTPGGPGPSSTTAGVGAAEATRAELDAWRAAHLAVYHAAHVLLRADFLDIQIFAGARHILGRGVRSADFVRSGRVVKRWGRCGAAPDGDADSSSTPDDDDAAAAAWHAALLLRAAAPALADPDATGLFHVPWCLYLATLTIWAFHHTSPHPYTHGASSASSRGPGGASALPRPYPALGRAGAAEDDDSDSELVWDARAEMHAVLDAMAGSRGDAAHLPALQGRHRTGALVWVVAEALSKVRWGIVHAGVAVLKGLVPLRLIGHFEDDEDGGVGGI